MKRRDNDKEIIRNLYYIDKTKDYLFFPSGKTEVLNNGSGIIHHVIWYRDYLVDIDTGEILDEIIFMDEQETESSDFKFSKDGRIKRKNIQDSDFNTMWYGRYLVDLDTGEILDERDIEQN